MPHVAESFDSRESTAMVRLHECLRTKSTVEALKRFLEKEKSMVTIKSRIGTPQGAEPCVVTCPLGPYRERVSRVRKKKFSAGILADDASAISREPVQFLR